MTRLLGTATSHLLNGNMQEPVTMTIHGYPWTSKISEATIHWQGIQTARDLDHLIYVYVCRKSKMNLKNDTEFT